MAPNVPLPDSEESSVELLLDVNVQPNEPIPELPKQLQPHLEHYFQQQDSPNLHQVRLMNLNGGRRTLPSTRQSSTTILRPRVINEDEVTTTTGATNIGEVSGFEIRDRNVRRRPVGSPQQPGAFQTGTLLPPTVPSRVRNPSEETEKPKNSSRGRELSVNPAGVPQGTRTANSGRKPGDGISLSTKDGPIIVAGGEDLRGDSNTKPPPPPPPPTSTSSTTTTTGSYIDTGVLRIPGHEPEAPADLNLVHHDRAIDTTNQTGLGGIFVKDDSNSLTTEGATALILVGLCSFFLVFICLVMFVQKIKRQKIESKVVQDDSDIKQTTRYEATGTTLHQPNPLSFLPPDILHALLHPLAAASKHHEVYEEPKPAFLTMEPPQPGNQLGRLWFSVYYDYVKSTLVLHILHARYVKGRGSTTNPGTVWVEACVLTPMNTIKASSKTDTRRASLAPVFNQNFKFEVEDEEVTQFLLRLTLYDKHPQNGEKAVGSVIVPLCTVDLCSTETISRDLQ